MTIDRRELLAGAGAVGLAALAHRAAAQTPPSSRTKVVDVHTHMYSQGWVKAGPIVLREIGRFGAGFLLTLQRVALNLLLLQLRCLLGEIAGNFALGGEQISL